MDWKLELVAIPVTDVDRAKAFYVDNVGFNADYDQTVSDEIRFVQLTPPGSACSIALGKGLTEAEPGSVKGLQLVVDGAGVQYGLDAARLPIWFATACDSSARSLAASWWRNVLSTGDRSTPQALTLAGDAIDPSNSVRLGLDGRPLARDRCCAFAFALAFDQHAPQDLARG